jgi:hypothetical protein
MRPGHHWICEFGDEGNGTSCEKVFNLSRVTTDVGGLSGHTEVKRILMYECRCNERLKDKDEGSTRLTYTG